MFQDVDISQNKGVGVKMAVFLFRLFTLEISAIHALIGPFIGVFARYTYFGNHAVNPRTAGV